MTTNTFEINNYLTLKLENNKSIIYVNNKKFIQCKYLLLNNQAYKAEVKKHNTNIDRIAESLDNSLEIPEENEFQIPVETEFWAHCSNLQAWADNGYDTQILHSNLAFPLLKRLTEVGDPLAKEVFKKEIIERFRDGNQLSVMTFLVKEGYLDYLSWDESTSLYEELDFETFKQLKDQLKVMSEEVKNNFLI